MKKRRTLVIGLLLVAALALGIGYAAFNSDMSVLGEVQMGGIASQVVFSAAAKNEEASTADVVTVEVKGLNSKSLELNLSGFVHAGHEAVVDVTISNPHDFPVVIKNFQLTHDEKTNPSGTQMFEFEIVDDALSGEPTIQGGQTLTFQLVVRCLATSPVDATENFRIDFQAASTVEEETTTPLT